MPSWAVGLDRNRRVSDDLFPFTKSVGDILNMYLKFKCMYSECRQLFLIVSNRYCTNVPEMIF